MYEPEVEFLTGLSKFLIGKAPDDVLRLVKHYCRKHLDMIPSIVMQEVHAADVRQPPHVLWIRIGERSGELSIDFEGCHLCFR